MRSNRYAHKYNLMALYFSLPMMSLKWNKLPPSLVQRTTINSFKFKLNFNVLQQGF